MSFANKLCNPMPFDSVVPYGRTKIYVEADGQTELTVEQLDDFRPGKPGSEEVRKTLEHAGCFLLDNDRPYDLQALRTMEASIKARQQNYREFVQRLRDNALAAGHSIDEESLEESIASYGYKRIRNEIEKLQDRCNKIKTALTASGQLSDGRHAPKLDPERTCFILDPPKEFPTKLSLELFLEENPEIQAQHEAYLAKINPVVEETPAVASE